ncbi:MAG TPA: LysM peptidoglycan-binding domain-containing protein, partial [Anaeromyxobacteraceae bacterium]|nr:LysM peptidoglycan-binding domain-containing protein [Anaeromyxobacteraceae bacterium]
MRASRLITVLVLAPVAVLGQTSALGEARKAGAVEKAGTEAHQRAADAQLDQGEEQKALVPPAAEGSPRAVQGDEGAQPSAKDDNLEVPDTHTVKPGDTLWDLSGRYLNNPWYWPKIWSYNPEISNPHFIYPGHAVRLRAGEGRVDDDDLESPRELEDLSRADMKKPQQIGDGDEVAVVGPYKIGYVAPRTLSASRDSFVTKRELEQSGVIRAAFEDKLLLTVHDRAYARFSDPAKVKVGDS